MLSRRAFDYEPVIGQGIRLRATLKASDFKSSSLQCLEWFLRGVTSSNHLVGDYGGDSRIVNTCDVNITSDLGVYIKCVSSGKKRPI